MERIFKDRNNATKSPLTQRLERIEKENVDLKLAIELLERKFEGLAAYQNKTTAKPVEKAPKVEPVQKKEENYEEELTAPLNKDLPKPVEKAPKVQKKEENYEEIGNVFAKYILDAFAVYGTGDFASWDKNRAKFMVSALNDGAIEEKVARNAACERILIEKMKEKEFFCCGLCDAVQFNYKQALIHFTGEVHVEREQAVSNLLVTPAIWFILNALTNLPKVLWKNDSRTEVDRHNKNSSLLTGALRPQERFVSDLSVKCTRPLSIGSAANITIASVTADTMANLKGGLAQRIYAELHEHIGQAKTWCPSCYLNTGDREGFYAHLVSSIHLIMLARGRMRVDILTMAVNVHRKDLI